MEPHQTKIDKPFGHQRKPVKITVDGEYVDVDYYMKQLMQWAKQSGDDVDLIHGNIFKIYPRAVND
jgi:hypothetical protein